MRAKMEDTKIITVIIEAKLIVPHDVELGVDMNNIPYYLEHKGKEIFPFPCFSVDGKSRSATELGFEVGEVDTKILG
jgi:hypothetical protein